MDAGCRHRMKGQGVAAVAAVAAPRGVAHNEDLVLVVRRLVG